MSVLHDLGCTACGTRMLKVMVKVDVLPPCQLCGGKTKTRYDDWKTVAGDFGCQPFYSDAAGRWFTSQHDQDRHMRGLDIPFYPAGDKVGGARTELKIHGSGFSYAGQGSRQSSQEHRRGRARVADSGGTSTQSAGEPEAQPGTALARPRRMTREAVVDRKASPIWKD